MTALRDQLQRTLSEQYVLDREIGRGGMATVYLARDTRHQRNVALKVLDPELGAVLGGERFLSEIRVTANLQHPNLLPLFDSGQADGLLYYVMPFVEGESLRARLDREKQLPIADAVRIATAVANALDYAHAHGVIHRDLKPENILLQQGQPVVADFGIALAVSNAGGTRVTQTGLSLGTPQYMSPEQATGDRIIDGRTDIYSLAAVTYEMLTGEPPHTGTSAQAIIAKLMTTTPQPVRILRPSVPANVASAVERGLEKLPADRIGSARAFADALANASYTAGPSTVPATSQARQPMRLVLALSALSLVSMAAAVWGWLRPSPPAPVLRYELALDSTASLLNTGRWGRIALSRDGSMFVYVGGPRNGLILRRRDQLAGSPIPGTDQAGAPEFSPDGKRVAFIQGASRLMITSLDGSPPALVTDTLLGLGGIAWAGNDTLYVDGRGPTPLVKVAARVRSRPEYIAPFDSSLGEVDQYWPEVLPGGALLYTISRGGLPHAIAILDPRSGARRVLIEGARRPRYANGYLFYVTIDGALMAVPFDHRGQIMKGDPVVVGAGLATAPLALDVTVSGNALAFVVGPTGGTELELIWVSRNGRVEVFDSTWRAPFADPAISPDGSRLAISDGITTGLGDVSNIWIRPMTSGGRMRLSAPRGRNRFPVWTRDGKHVLYSSSQDSIAMIMENPADGSIAATPRIAYREAGIGVVTATPDGEWIVFTRGLARGSRLHVHRRGDTAATRLIAEESPQSSPAFSPDGRFLAFVGSDDGVSKVYVSPFPNPANERWLVSPTFGNEPVWSNKGNELFYRDVSANTLVAVPVNTVGRFSLGAPQVLFSVPGTARFAVSRDDSRFLMVRPVGASMASRDRLTMVENWVEGLRPTVRP